MATLYYVENVHFAQARTRIPSPYFCVGQESESESGNITKPLHVVNVALHRFVHILQYHSINLTVNIVKYERTKDIRFVTKNDLNCDH